MDRFVLKHHVYITASHSFTKGLKTPQTSRTMPGAATILLLRRECLNSTPSLSLALSLSSPEKKKPMKNMRFLILQIQCTPRILRGIRLKNLVLRLDSLCWNLQKNN